MRVIYVYIYIERERSKSRSISIGNRARQDRIATYDYSHDYHHNVQGKR